MYQVSASSDVGVEALQFTRKVIAYIRVKSYCHILGNKSGKALNRLLKTCAEIFASHCNCTLTKSFMTLQTFD